MFLFGGDVLLGHIGKPNLATQGENGFVIKLATKIRAYKVPNLEVLKFVFFCVYDKAHKVWIRQEVVIFSDKQPIVSTLHTVGLVLLPRPI